MKLGLGEAIRLGSMASEKTKFMRHDEAGRSCAIGAAELAVGDVAERYWPFLWRTVQHPVVKKPMVLVAVIASLNNGSIWAYFNDGGPLNITEWSREQIADWVETIERSIEAPVERTIEQLVEV